MKKQNSLKALTLALTATAVATPSAQALDQIIRPYQGIRMSGMGGARITTGLYDENMFYNPARVTANPSSKFQFVGIMAEVGNSSNISKMMDGATGGGDIVKGLSSTAGSNTHLRLQTEFPAFYLASNENRHWAFGFGMFTSTQVDATLRNSFQIAPQAVTDVGPVFSFGYKLLEDKLAIGLNTHMIYRLATSSTFTFAQLLKGSSLSPTSSGAQGAMLDFDLGSTYELPVLLETPYRLTVAATINNFLGGGYSNLGGNLISALKCTNADGSICRPPRSDRAFGLGIAANRPTWGPFVNTVLAFEITDIGSNSNSNLGPEGSSIYGHGSLFRSLHLGAETTWKVFSLRGGINQGYFTAGLGIDLRILTLDVATYGEEMGLNTGDMGDRRYAAQIGLQI